MSSVFLVALLVRMVVAIGINVLADGTLFGDDAFYSFLARAVSNDATQNWPPYAHYLYESTATFMYPLTWLFQISGDSALVGQLFVVVIGAGTAAAVTGLAMSVLRPVRAAVSGIVVALLPSQVLWSSLILKDAAVWLILAVVALLVVRSNRDKSRVMWRALVGIAFLLLLMSRLREHSLLVACWALVLAALFGGPRLYRQRLLACAAIAVLVPWVGGFGPAGYDFVRDAGSLQERRLRNAERAASAIVEPNGSSEGTEGPGGAKTDGDDNGQGIDGNGGQGIDGNGGQGIDGNGGQGTDNGDTDAGFALEDTAGGLGADISHLPRGLSAMLLEPFPWQSSTSSYYSLAKLEIVVWYPVLVFALIGLIQAFRYMRVMAFPLFAGAGSLAVYALSEGNLGTAVRHRGEFTWVVALFAGLGLWTWLDSRGVRDERDV